MRERKNKIVERVRRRGRRRWYDDNEATNRQPRHRSGELTDSSLPNRARTYEDHCWLPLTRRRCPAGTTRRSWSAPACWCPGVIVFLYYFSLHIFYKQPKRIHPIWNVLQCDFCELAKMSGGDVNGGEALHSLDTSLDS